MFLDDEAQIRQDDVDAGLDLARERHAEVDHQPLPGVRRAEAVEVDVHADLAEAAERHEYELVSDSAGLTAALLRHCVLSSYWPPRCVGAISASDTSPCAEPRVSPLTTQQQAPPSSRSREGALDRPGTGVDGQPLARAGRRARAKPPRMAAKSASRIPAAEPCETCSREKRQHC